MQFQNIHKCSQYFNQSNALIKLCMHYAPKSNIREQKFPSEKSIGGCIDCKHLRSRNSQGIESLPRQTANCSHQIIFNERNWRKKKEPSSTATSNNGHELSRIYL